MNNKCNANNNKHKINASQMQIKCKANTKNNSYAKQIHFINKINAEQMQFIYKINAKQKQIFSY